MDELRVANDGGVLKPSSNNKNIRLYPIFEKREQKRKSSPSEIRSAKKRKATPRRRLPFLKSDEQYVIDAGQRDFDATRCKMCNMLYTVGEESDENHHAKYHDMFVNGVKYKGWKQERVLKYFDDGSRILSVIPGDPKFMLKKVDELFTVADLDLGINVDVQSSIKDSSLYLLYISIDKRIAGFVAAEAIEEASPLISEDPLTVSTSTVPASVGVSRIWVHPNYRRQRVATYLLDVLRANFHKNGIVQQVKLAFSDPTVIGKDFAKRYTGTRNFLVFQYQPNCRLFSR